MMRTTEEMMAQLYAFVDNNDDIRIFAMEGSRMNSEIKVDAYQDFDVTFFVDNLPAWIDDESWLDYFGPRLIVQKPDAMTLYPAGEFGFSYLILFEDGQKMDLTLNTMADLDRYIESEALATVLVDKDQLLDAKVQAEPSHFHLKQPNVAEFDDCCNEFWWVTTYVAKGLLRHEVLFAMDHLNEILRPELFRMLSWQVGFEHGFNRSIGKNYKFLPEYLADDEWADIMASFNMQSEEAVWQAMFLVVDLFVKSSKTVAALIGANYPAYEEKVMPVLLKAYADYQAEL